MKTGPRTILLAEDNEDDAFLTTRALESAGVSHAIFQCRDGEAVIEYLEGVLSGRQEAVPGGLPELVLLDLKMPRLDGLETLKWIRRHEKLAPLPVLALTSSSEQKDVKTAYEFHINAYLVKPSTLGEMTALARAIREFWLDENHLIRPQISFPSPFGLPRY